MIPYVISQPNPNYKNYRNTHTTFCSCETKEELTHILIHDIVESMYEFCSKEYGPEHRLWRYSD